MLLLRGSITQYENANKYRFLLLARGYNNRNKNKTNPALVTNQLCACHAYSGQEMNEIVCI